MSGFTSWLYGSSYFGHYFARRRKQREEAELQALEGWVKAQIADLDRWVDQRFPSSQSHR